MSLLQEIRKRLLGEAGMMQPTGIISEPTQGLLGTGGQFGEGTMQQRVDQPGGLFNVQNVPELALLGSAIYGQGIKGKDPLESLFPAYTQAAQVKKILTPKQGALKQAYDPKTKSVVYATDKEIRERNLTPALPTKTLTQTPGGGLQITESYGTGGTTTNSKSIETANEIYSTAQAMNNVANNLFKNLKNSKTGFVGETIEFIDSFGSQVKQAADSFGFAQNYEDTGSGAIDAIMTDDFKISKEAANYGKIKSAAINLAYLVARIDEPGGRFTDRDIALKMKEFGFGANPERTIEIMKNAIDLRNKNAQNSYKILTGVDMPGFETNEKKKKKDILDEENPFNLNL